MAISDISREKFALVKEAALGTQVTDQLLQVCRITSEGLKQDTDIMTSREIRDDRQIAAVARTRIAVSGPIEFEVSFSRSIDELMAAALMSTDVKAQGTLTMDTLPTDGDTITIDTTTYTFKDTLAAANQIKIAAADLAATQASLVATMNGTGTAGTDYYAGTTTPHPSVRAGAFASDDSIFTALNAGIPGNSIATTETFTAETNVFDAATLGTTRAGAGWTAPVTKTAITLSASSVDNSFNDSGSGFAFTANEWVRVSGFATAANNGHFKIVSATAAKIVVSGGTLVTEAAGESVTITQGGSITNGTTKNSFNLERTYTDLTTELALYVGCMVNQFNVAIGTNGMIIGSVGMMGQRETSPNTSGGAGYIQAETNEIMNSIDHVSRIYEAAAAISLLDFNITVTNNLREQPVIGTLGPASFGTNPVNISGSFTAYYESKTLYDKYLDFTTTSLAIAVQDTDGNGYVIDMPEVKITDGSRNAAAGLGDDFKVPCTFQAFRDAAEDITIRIVRFAA